MFTDRSKAVLLLWIIYVSFVLCLLCICARLFICALWSPAGRGLTSWLLFVVSNCEFVTFLLVSWVKLSTKYPSEINNNFENYYLKSFIYLGI